ncbi:MAG: CpsD/CapB family tyrosine-protein kinase [Clostridia bacterium]|nr:CpsD/CapB family tyrosine-protein kinase [Clostridia bacterium]
MKKSKKKSFFSITDSQKTLHKNLEFTASEQYKLLRANLSFTLPENEGCNIIGVTSSMRGEGKSTTAVNLSYVLAESRKKVLLIDGDLRIPSVAKKMKIESSPGLTDLLRGKSPVDLSEFKTPFLSNWYIIPSGALPPNPSELLGSKRMETTLKELSAHFDYIVVDLPPVNIVSDALAISKYIDGMIVVIREEYTEKKELETCFRQLRLSNVNVLGCVMNETKSGKGYYSKYRYKRYYKYYKTYGNYDSSPKS